MSELHLLVSVKSSLPSSTRMRWRSRATDSNGSISWLRNCSSGLASAPRGRGGLVHIRLQGTGIRPRHRRSGGIGSRAAPAHLTSAKRAGSPANGRWPSAWPAHKLACPTHIAQPPSLSPDSSTVSWSSTTTVSLFVQPSSGTTPSRRMTPRRCSRCCPMARPAGPTPVAAFPCRASPSPSCTGCAAESQTSLDRLPR